MEFLTIVLIIYFAINIFMAGVYSVEDCNWRKDELHGVVTVVFWSLFFCLVMALSNIHKFILHIWKRTWLCHYIQLRNEEKKYLGDTECEISIKQLKFLIEVIKRKRTLRVIKQRQIKICAHQIELIKKNALEKHGEIIN